MKKNQRDDLTKLNMLKHLRNIICMLLFGLICSVSNILAQTPDDSSKKVNFRYSQNPKIKTKLGEKDQKQADESNAVEARDSKAKEIAGLKIETETGSTETQPNGETVADDGRSIAAKTMEIAKRGVKTAISPTEIYKVGIGDVLFVSLQNAPSGSTTYFTVLNDGTIDYPLALETVVVQGLTTDEIEDLLEANIKIFEDPQVAVRVREHASHNISVIGLVEKPGVKLLQREAVPLFVVRAEAIVRPDANKVTIRRANSESESYDLTSENNDNILVFPGDIVEFLAFVKPDTVKQVPQFYYVGGNIRTVGQMEFYKGITLSQAILASGGLRKAKETTVIIRRKNTEGLLESTVYDLAEIKNGKIPDPFLAAGDTIEVGN